MKYVKDNIGYSEIGGVYVKKQSGGWKLIVTNAEAISLGEGMKNDYFLDLYIDRVVEKAIEPASQTQPHVIVRPRTSFFEGVDFQLKRNFVTVQEVKQQKLDKKKLAKDAYEQEKKSIENVPDQQINKKRNRRSDNEKKIASELTEKKNATEKENNNATDNEPQQKKNPSEKEMPVPSGKEKATSKAKVVDY
ncbi:uncharacterized protein LOC141689497 [Apium graveolens]|uniref:uncharacterized protein LOC141689497 n=1 Tax=Apium graveolens TaxID=4045 RepID=UPI003D78E3AB